jgi:molecular chaperone GrpE
MTWFNKKKMSEQDFNEEEIFEENGEEVPNEEADESKNVNSKQEKSKESTKPAREIELENKLREEIARREAAEGKLVGVQAKFDEANAQRERETQEMRERMRKTLEDRAKQGQFNFLTTLLPVLDNLNRAIVASESDASFEHLLDGVKGTARSFEQALMSVGVEPVVSIGSDFNPELHEAVDMVETEPDNDGKITAEYARGYKFGERLLRPARVQVGKAMAQKAGE